MSTAQQSLAPPTSSPGIETFFSPWAPYTPDWVAASTNPAIGNGTIVGRFRRLGTSLELNVTITSGTTTTYGTGAMAIRLPSGVTARTVTNGMQSNGKAVITLGAGFYECVPQILSGSNDIYLNFNPGTGGPLVNVRNDAPIAPGAGFAAATANQIINLDMTLEVAP